MTTEIHHIPAFKGALGTVERLLVGDLLQHHVPEVAQQVDALVPHLVDARGELLAAQLTRGVVALDVYRVLDGQGGQVGDVLELGLALLPLLAAVLHLDNVQVARRREEL